MLSSRRSFLQGLIAAPAIIPINHLMPVKALYNPDVTNLINFIGDALKKSLNQNIFEFNNELTHQSIRNTMDTYMTNLMNRRKIEDYKIICSHENNPNLYELNASIMFKIKKSSPFHIIDGSVA